MKYRVGGVYRDSKTNIVIKVDSIYDNYVLHHTVVGDYDLRKFMIGSIFCTRLSPCHVFQVNEDIRKWLHSPETF